MKTTKLNEEQVSKLKEIANKYDAFLTYSVDQTKLYFNFDERIADAFGEEIIGNGNLLEKEVMSYLPFVNGALLQSEIDEISYNTLAFEVEIEENALENIL